MLSTLSYCWLVTVSYHHKCDDQTIELNLNQQEEIAFVVNIVVLLSFENVTLFTLQVLP